MISIHFTNPKSIKRLVISYYNIFRTKEARTREVEETSIVRPAQGGGAREEQTGGKKCQVKYIFVCLYVYISLLYRETTLFYYVYVLCWIDFVY